MSERVPRAAPSEIPMLDALHRDRESVRRYTDMKIVCGQRQFFVHKTIVCLSCDFFEKAMCEGWKESQEKVIILPEEDDADIVALFLDALYEKLELEAIPAGNENRQLTIITKIFILGEKYLAPVARDRAIYLTNNLYENCYIKIPDIIKALELAYTSMRSADWKTRAHLQPIVIRYKVYLADDPDFKALIQSDTSFAKDFMFYMFADQGALTIHWRNGSKNKTYSCSTCDLVIHSKHEPDEDAVCPFCEDALYSIA